MSRHFRPERTTPEILYPDAVLSGPAEDFANWLRETVSQGAQQGREFVESRGGTAVQELIKTTEFQQILNLVEQKAQEGVKKEVSRNAIQLFALGAAAGALGSVVFKGTAGLVGAGLLAAWAANSLTSTPKDK